MYHATNMNKVHTDGRRAMRLDVKIKAGLREAGSFKFEVQVIDISVTGFRIETSFNMETGSRVFLNLPGLEGKEANVMWRDGFVYGCAFTTSLHPAVLDHVVARCK